MTDASDLSPEHRALFTLTLVPNLGPRLIRALVQRFGSAQDVLRAGPAQLNDVPRLGEHLAGEFGQLVRDLDPERELALLVQHGVRLVFQDEAEYPAALLKIHDPPP